MEPQHLLFKVKTHRKWGLAWDIGHIWCLLKNLPGALVATDEEALLNIERRTLMGRGIGYIDAHLLAAVALEGTARLWTRDKRLHAAAHALSLAASLD